MVKLTYDPIDVNSVIESLKNEEAGSIVVFIGEPRKGKGDGNVTSIIYTAYEEMAESELRKIESEALKKDGIRNVAIIHRLGNVPLKEVSLLVCVSSRHRKEGFEVCQDIIEKVKEVVPIWKEIKYDGDGNS